MVWSRYLRRFIEHVDQEPDPYAAFNSHFRNLFESGDPSLPPWTSLVSQFVPKRYHVFLDTHHASGTLIPIQYSGENTTVFELKNFIRSLPHTKVPPHWQNLYLEREPPLDAVLLDDEQTMEHYNVQDGDKIFIYYWG